MCHRSKTWGDVGADEAPQYIHVHTRAQGPHLPYLSIEHPHRPDHSNLPGHSCPLSFFFSPPGPLCSPGWGQRLEVGWAWVLGTESQLGLQAWSRHKAAGSLGLDPAQHPGHLPLFLSVTCFTFLSRLWGSEGSCPQWQQTHWRHVPFLLPRRLTLPLGICLRSGRPVVVTASLELYSQPGLAAVELDGIKEPLAFKPPPMPPCRSPGPRGLGGG